MIKALAAIVLFGLFLLEVEKHAQPLSADLQVANGVQAPTGIQGPTGVQGPTGIRVPIGVPAPTGVPPPTGPVSIGSISGTLQTEDGKSATAVIRALRISPLPTGAPIVVTSASATVFQIPGLPPGNFEICATVLAGGYVDPCLWESSGLLVTVKAGQTTSTILTIKKASALKVHVDDPGKLIKDSPQAALLLGVATSGRVYPLLKKNEDIEGNIEPGTRLPLG